MQAYADQYGGGRVDAGGDKVIEPAVESEAVIPTYSVCGIASVTKCVANGIQDTYHFYEKDMRC